MMGTILFAILAAASLIAAAPPTANLQPYLEEGMEVETRFDGDFTGDGIADLAFVQRKDDERELVALVGYRTETDFGFDKVGIMALDPFPLGAASLQVKNGALLVDDLTGGTTAVSSLYRLRFDPVKKRMRLIGLDAKQYSRTNNHGWASISWNVLTGAVLREQAALIEGENHSDNAYGPTRSKREQRKSKPLFMEDAPSGDSLINEGT